MRGAIIGVVVKAKAAARRAAPRLAVVGAFVAIGAFAIDARMKLDRCKAEAAACHADLAPEAESWRKLLLGTDNAVRSLSEIRKIGAFVRERGQPCPRAARAYHIESHPDGTVIRVICESIYRVVRIPSLGVERVEVVAPEGE